MLGIASIPLTNFAAQFKYSEYIEVKPGPRGSLFFDITKEFKNSWCTVDKTSGATIQSLLNSIPVITNDDLCSSYEVAEHDIKNIMNPRMPDRKQWLYNLCYSQWNLEEIAEGLPWSHLRQYLYNE